MSYRERRLRKARRSKTPGQLRRLYTRDLRFCRRWNIPLTEAWKWDRQPLEDYQP